MLTKERIEEIDQAIDTRINCQFESDLWLERYEDLITESLDPNKETILDQIKEHYAISNQSILDNIWDSLDGSEFELKEGYTLAYGTDAITGFAVSETEDQISFDEFELTRKEANQLARESDHCIHIQPNQDDMLVYQSRDEVAEIHINWSDMNYRFEDTLLNHFEENLSGSGFNSSWHSPDYKGKKGKIRLTQAFECMDQNGYYVGYADFSVYFNPVNWQDFKLEFNGKRSQALNQRFQLREYIEESIYSTLNSFFTN